MIIYGVLLHGSRWRGVNSTHSSIVADLIFLGVYDGAELLADGELSVLRALDLDAVVFVNDLRVLLD